MFQTEQLPLVALVYASLHAREKREASIMRSMPVFDAASGQAAGRAQEHPARSHSFLRVGSVSAERVLLVEPDAARRARLRDTARTVADIDGDGDFLIARTHLISKPYDWLFTNIRLGAYNGLHLVHLARTSRRPIRSLVYGDGHDVWLAREAQRIGAFYESGDRVNRTLTNYLRGALPLQDRRDPGRTDRRVASRGGRRCSDSSFASSFV